MIEARISKGLLYMYLALTFVMLHFYLGVC